MIASICDYYISGKICERSNNEKNDKVSARHQGVYQDDI
jgi:hypothetical protein